MPHAMAILAVMISIAFLCVMSAEAHAYPNVTWDRVDDRPLLESPDQVRDARLLGECTFRIGGETFTVRDLPRGYLDYSAKCVRMP